jgi:ABC-type antimicrobial peptide transport system permease subunit
VDRRAALALIQPVFLKYSPGSPFDYSFTEEDYSAKFRAVERVGDLSGMFTVLAMFISCLGLFGLASFVAEQRTREIGIRKVLGASVWQLWGLLSREFVVLVMVAFAIAAPIAWVYGQEWLRGFDYRANFSVWIFVVAGTGAVAIALIVVSLQSVRAAWANPVESLRAE